MLFCHLERKCSHILCLGGFKSALPKPLLISSLFLTEWEARDSHWMEIANSSEWGIFFVMSSALRTLLQFIKKCRGFKLLKWVNIVCVLFKTLLKENKRHLNMSCSLFTVWKTIYVYCIPVPSHHCAWMLHVNLPGVSIHLGLEIKWD